MSRVVDVPNALGEYMLRGWVLTDSPCPAPSCRGVPLLRSPEGQQPVVRYCANCDGPPKTQWSEGMESHSSSTISSTSHGSRPSTPPTDLSSTLSSPTFAPPAETEDIIRRRQQSDRASTEIGKRLLKGWAMLAEECPNTRCYGVPLVRPPKTGVDKDPRKECIICGTIYVTEDSEGWQRLVPVSTGVSASEHGLTRGSQQSGPSDKSKAISHDSPQPIQLPTLDPPFQTPKLTVDLPRRVSSELRSTHLVAAVPATSVPLDASIQALELALGALSERLAMTCTNPHLLDPSSVAATAEAIGKVAHALGQVKQLQHPGGTLSSLMS
ncbi:hypothetical protein HD554DRAFT_2048231 [Boletus coccyginus]|nr:hypothetical protein HD554DRAFT_2048231 [Boletus coccyginus]